MSGIIILMSVFTLMFTTGYIVYTKIKQHD